MARAATGNQSDFGRRRADWEARSSDKLTAGEAGEETLFRIEVAPLYTHLDGINRDPAEEIGLPGEYPYTRGSSAAGYREQLWVMGQYSGHGSPRKTNERIRDLLAQGQRGFSVALDLPTQLGLDSDDPRARGEVGRVGVPIDTVHDMVELLDGIELDQVRQIRTTANAIGPFAVALFVAAADHHGFSAGDFKVMLQNDVLKEYVARGTQIFPPANGLQFSVDVVEYCARELPHWEPIEFCGYHIRDAGADAIHELAIAMANGLEYIDATIARGLSVDDFAGSTYLFLSAHLDLLEEVAKFRAARRIWARLLRERYDASDAAGRANIFVYTLGSPQTAQEPLNNIVRIAYQALAAVLGGVQTLATSAYDEAIQLPSDEAVRLALRTQQILGYELGVARTVDPLGGSYVIEELTDRIEAAVHTELDRIAELGGALAALESGWVSAAIDEEAHRQQELIESGERVVVGVNQFRSVEAEAALSHRITTDPRLEAEQVERLRAIRERRDGAGVTAALEALQGAARAEVNTIPFLIAAVKAEATIGEVFDALKAEWGEYAL
jgi:methylmalonyl-CoA mutase N-terminal domain/subunit